MPFVRQPVWSSQYNHLDPERVRVREEMRQRAVRDATNATDAVRAKLRRNLTVAACERGHGRNSAQVQRPTDSS